MTAKGEKGRQRIEEHHDIRRLAEKLEASIQEALA